MDLVDTVDSIPANGPMRSAAGARGGLTRLEVVAVVATAALLLQLAIPLLGLSREAARRWRCTANLAGIGRALARYHAAHGALPPAAFWESSELVVDRVRLSSTERDRRGIMATRQNWLQLLLPELGKQDLALAFDPSLSMMAPENRSARNAELPLARCPSDSFNRSDNPYIHVAPDGTESRFARGSYAINGGTQAVHAWPGFLSYTVPNGSHYAYDPESGLFQLWGNGVAGFNRSFSFDDFRNGRATTVAVNEIRAGLAAGDPRGAWALGQVASSVTWAHGINGDDCGPNNQWRDSDDLLDGGTLYYQLGADWIAQQRMPFCDHCNRSNQATSRSEHPGGVNTLMLDGAVRFVTDDVDDGLWHVMHSRETPADVLAGDIGRPLANSRRPPAAAGARARPRPDGGGAKGRAGNGARSAFENSIGMRFVRIPAGEFIMGLPDAGNVYPFPGEAVRHRVRITRPFHMAVCEVTQGQFSTVMGRNPSWHRDREDPARSDRLPVESVTWDEAVAFCEKLSALPAEKAAGRTYGLPTEAQWEYAARAGSTEPYRFVPTWQEDDQTGIIAGKDWTPIERTPEPVGSYPPNPFGLHDMCGNVFEWCADRFQRDYYAVSPIEDPPGPATGYLRVVRGWYWRFIGAQCKAFYLTTAPWRRNRYLGFRVVCRPRHRVP